MPNNIMAWPVFKVAFASGNQLFMFELYNTLNLDCTTKQPCLFEMNFAV